MQLLTLGINHQTAPLALRERVSFVPDEVSSVIARLRDRLSRWLLRHLLLRRCRPRSRRTRLRCRVRGGLRLGRRAIRRAREAHIRSQHKGLLPDGRFLASLDLVGRRLIGTFTLVVP